MVSTKDLRDIFNDLTTEAGKKANEAFKNAEIPDIGIGRRSDTSGFLFFAIGLAFGTLIGVVAAFLMTPYKGEEARQKLADQVDKMRKRDEIGSLGTNGGSAYTSTPTSAYERS